MPLLRSNWGLDFANRLPSFKTQHDLRTLHPPPLAPRVYRHIQVASDGSHFFAVRGMRRDAYRVSANDEGRRNVERWPRPFGLRSKSGHTSFSPSTVGPPQPSGSASSPPHGRRPVRGGPVLAEFSPATLAARISRYTLVSALNQDTADCLHYRIPVSMSRLTEKPHRRIPWAVFAFQKPTPVRRKRKQ